MASDSKAHDELQAEFFGFSSRGFTNFYYNQLVSVWAVIVEEVVLPPLVTNGPHSDIDEEVFREKLLDRLFQHGKVDCIMHEVQKHAMDHIFTIPDHVTLPAHSTHTNNYDEPDLSTEIQKRRNSILKLRYTLEYIRKERLLRSTIASKILGQL